MTDRIKRMKARLDNNTKDYPLCVEKLEITTKVLEENMGWPLILARAKAQAAYCDQRTLFIDDDDLLIGNYASKPYGLEFKPFSAGWTDEDLKDMKLLKISEEDRLRLRALDKYWENRGRTLDEQSYEFFTIPFLWNFCNKGINCPPWQPRRTRGMAGDGWGMKNPWPLMLPDWKTVLDRGYQSIVDEAKSEMEKSRFQTFDAIDRYNFLKSVVITFEAAIRMANRYADLADSDAAKKDAAGDRQRAEELREMARIMRRVPANKPNGFREALQSWIFSWMFLSSGTLGLGRFDQYMYPYYKMDKDAGKITDDEVIELLGNMRLKIMQFNYCAGGAGQRDKWAGLARWNNTILGGCDVNGVDSCNELTILVMKAALDVRTPHPTLTLRVNKDTPDEVMAVATELVSTGIGFPAFISEDQYIDYFMKNGVEDIRDAREFGIAGCLDLALPGNSRGVSINMFLVPLVLVFAMFDGKDPRDGIQYGPQTGEFKDFDNFEDFYNAFLKQIDHFVDINVDRAAIWYKICADLWPDAFSSAFYKNSMETGKDIMMRPMLWENNTTFNVVGMANAINSLAAIKKLCFVDKTVSPETMYKAILANWEGYEDVHRMCLKAPKYGNDDDFVDSIGEKLWEDMGKMTASHKNVWGSNIKNSAISITSHGPGGKYTPATPDGRYDGDTLADGGASPVQGTDVSGLLAVMNSARRMGHGWSVTLFNQKLSPSAVKTEADRAKLGSMIKIFLTNGGKQVQFNVVSRETLESAKARPDDYKNLIVRVAGYSTYFVNLTPTIMDEVIARTEHQHV